MMWFITSVGSAPIYNKPSFNSNCLTETVYGESNKILDSKKNWIYIECQDGYKGWINEFYGAKQLFKNRAQFIIAYPNEHGLFDPDYPFSSRVKKKVIGAKPIDQPLDFNELIYLATKLLGIPYKWGGKTSLGFDCSGLVQSVLKVCGYNVPRDSYQQKDFFRNHKINIIDAQPGDLHFFGKLGKVSHVGFSTGGDGILHAQGSVKKESLNPNHTNFNKNLFDLYLSSNSIRRKFKR